MKHKSIGTLKAMTREQLLGNYGKLSSYVLLYFLLVFSLSQILLLINMNNYVMQILSNLIQVIFTDIFVAGMYRVCMLNMRGQQITLRDYFYVFTHDPDKVVIISAIRWAMLTVTTLPVSLMLAAPVSTGAGRGVTTLVSCVILCVLIVAYVYVSILIAMWMQIYLDRPEYGVREILMNSFVMMRNNKLRYLYLLFNQFCIIMLIVLTATIGALWLMPFSCVLNLNFYEDVKGETDGYNFEVEG